jgi:hypothetical protein
MTKEEGNHDGIQYINSLFNLINLLFEGIFVQKEILSLEYPTKTTKTTKTLNLRIVYFFFSYPHYSNFSDGQ